jgi:hypothetical protein
LHKLEIPLDLEATIKVNEAEVLLRTIANGTEVPFLCEFKGNNIFVINTHTFSEADFEAVGEVLLCPRPLGLLDLPREWINTIRIAFNSKLGYVLDAPSRVSMQTLANGDVFLQNYNKEEVSIMLSSQAEENSFRDKLSGNEHIFSSSKQEIKMLPRSRLWLVAE